MHRDSIKQFDPLQKCFLWVKLQKMAERGKFIVIEGTDGSGKKTQVGMLAGYLQSRGSVVYTVDFPQYDTSFFGAVVGRLMAGDFGGIKDIHPVLASIPYACDRLEKSEDIRRALASGSIVVANRYTASNKAHQAAKLPAKQRREFIQFLDRMEYDVLGVPREDTVLLLSVVAMVGRRLVDKKPPRAYLRGAAKRDIHEADLGHQREAAKVYKWMAKQYSHWTVIECCNRDGGLQNPEEIHKKIVEVVRTKVFPE